MRSIFITAFVMITLFIMTESSKASGLIVGAAPKGEPSAVATKIIKYNFPNCKQVSSAIRSPDGSIRAKWDDTNYLVFTMYNAEKGKAIEVALNCKAAKSLLNIDC